MVEAFILLACVAFIGSLLPLRGSRYAGGAGWIFIIAALYAELPYYFSINNFLYPLFALLSIPFLIITLLRLHAGDDVVIRLSRAAAIAFIIYAPFAYIEPLGNSLIRLVVDQTLWFLDALDLPSGLAAWNIITRNGFRTEIILACTGIQSIAIMLGVVAGVATTRRQKFTAFLLIAPVIYILNILRNTFVIAAYTEQWFPYLPEIASNGEYGYESFFWAHNVIAEFLALFVLIGLAYELFVIIPDLGDWAGDLYTMYREEILKVLRWLHILR